MSNKDEEIAQPTKYKPEYCEAIIAYFDVPYMEKYEYQQATAGGKVVTLTGERPVKLPSLYQFAKSIGVRRETLYLWKEKFPEFREAYIEAGEIRKEMFIHQALNNNYNATFSKFYAVNCTDMKPEQLIVHERSAIKEEKPIQVIFKDDRVKKL